MLYNVGEISSSCVLPNEDITQYVCEIIIVVRITNEIQHNAMVIPTW